MSLTLIKNRKRLYCPHCGDYVSKSVYYNHKKLHFDGRRKRWKQESSGMTARSELNRSIVSFEFSPENDVDSVDADIFYDDAHADDESNEFSPEGNFVNDAQWSEFDVDSNDDLTNSDSSGDDSNNELDVELSLADVADNEAETNPNISRPVNKVIQAFVLFLFMWQSLFRISDSAISLLLSFMAKFLSLISNQLKINLVDLMNVFPHTIYRAKKLSGQLNDSFKQYVSCPKCHTIYRFEDCWKYENNVKVSKKCMYVEFPNHIQSRMRIPCDHILLKTVRATNGSTYLQPYKTYCYQSIVDSFEQLLNRPNFIQTCEQWRSRINYDVNVMQDVYDGEIWKRYEFDDNGAPFLSAPYNYLLMLNCDWFQPYKHTQFSVGVLYFAIQNLPRELRFIRENIIIVGIMPGPSELKKNINTYLRPMIDELLTLWKGVAIEVNGKQITIRVAVSCLACDIPAARKVGGFIGHRGKRGCSRCWKEFPTIDGKDYPDYSGFDKQMWEPRSHALHVWYALQQQNSKTKDERREKESNYGARYSLLYDLPYYNAISSCIVDPMHCLYLGIAKRFFHIWLTNQILSKDQLMMIQQKVDAMCCPPDIGRIPYKIVSNFAGLKADQWKNWTLYFSLFSLKEFVPYRDYNCWLLFVKICSKICRREIAIPDLDEIDIDIKNFCVQFESLYGKAALTPNIHLLGHITDCIRDHGPVYAFWLYAFERMNGVLGSFQTNFHDINVQLMRRFTTMQRLTIDNWPIDMREHFSSLMEGGDKNVGSLGEMMLSDKSSTIIPLPPIQEIALDDDEIQEIRTIFESIHPITRIVRLCKSCKAIAVSDTIVSFMQVSI